MLTKALRCIGREVIGQADRGGAGGNDQVRTITEIGALEKEMEIGNNWPTKDGAMQSPPVNCCATPDIQTAPIMVNV